MKNSVLSLLMALSSIAIMAKGSNEPKITVTNIDVDNTVYNWKKYKGQYLSYFDTVFKVKYAVAVHSPARLKCCLYMVKKDFNDPRRLPIPYTQALEESPGSFSLPYLITDLTPLEKIYEFPSFTVTQDTTGGFDWDGYTWEIQGIRYPIRDYIAVVLEDADTGELYLWDGRINFGRVSRYGDDHYGGNGFGAIFEVTQNSVTANIFFRSVLPSKNVTVFLAKENCEMSNWTSTVVNQGGKAMMTNPVNNSFIIAYRELGPVAGGETINEFMWENITTVKGDLFTPNYIIENDGYYQMGLILEGENNTATVNLGFYEGGILGGGSGKLLLPDLNRESNTGAPYHVAVAGTLAALLGNSIDTITVLSLSGTINGYDVETIRKMKNLSVLGLSRVDIVQGGDLYSEYYYTRADKVSEFLFADLALTSVALPNNAGFCSEYAFNNCFNMSTITLGVNTKAGESFPNPPLLKEYIVPVKSAYCSSDNGVLFSKDKTTLIKYPHGKIDDSYTIPNGTITIGTFAITPLYTLKLKKVVIPNGVTTIEYQAIGGNELNEIYCYNPAPIKIGTDCFVVDFETCKLYVPKGSKAAYAAADGWKDFKNIIEMSGAAIDLISTDAVSIYSTPGGITIHSLNETIPVFVYSITGQKVYESMVQGNEEIRLSKGAYIVKAGQTIKKVVVD